MSLPPLLSTTITATPSSGAAYLEVDFTSGAVNYTVIEETGTAPNTITEAAATDSITEQ